MVVKSYGFPSVHVSRVLRPIHLQGAARYIEPIACFPVYGRILLIYIRIIAGEGQRAFYTETNREDIINTYVA